MIASLSSLYEKMHGRSRMTAKSIPMAYKDTMIQIFQPCHSCPDVDQDRNETATVRLLACKNFLPSGRNFYYYSKLFVVKFPIYKMLSARYQHFLQAMDLYLHLFLAIFYARDRKASAGITSFHINPEG